MYVIKGIIYKYFDFKKGEIVQCFERRFTSVDPVKVTLFTSMCSEIAAPAVGP